VSRPANQNALAVKCGTASAICAAICFGNVIETHEHTGDFKAQYALAFRGVDRGSFCGSGSLSNAGIAPAPH
jgi:hypothetical protein